MKKIGMMEIAFTNGIVKADAKTGMVDFSTLTTVGNLYRAENGLDVRSVQNWKNKKETQELINKLEEKFLNNESSVLEKTENVIKVTKGRYGTTWGNIILAIDYAMWLDVDFKIEVIETFLESKILYFRMLGIDHYKELNNAIDTLEDRTLELKPKGNRGCYINISKAINVRINGEFVKGWDEENADSSKTKLRDKILEQCKMLIKMKFIKTYPALKEFIENYEEV